MKVLFIASDNNNASGAFISMSVLIQHLNRRGIVTKVILPYKGTGTTLLDNKDIDYQVVKSYDWVRPINEKKSIGLYIRRFYQRIINHFAVNQIANIIKDENFNIIHINTIYSYVGALAASKLKVPFLWHLREVLEEGQNRCFISPQKSEMLIGKANCICAISKSVYSKYSQTINCRNMYITYNGIDSKVFYNPQKTIFNNNKSIIMFVGGFNKAKGAYTVADALKKLLLTSNEKIEVWFVGNPPNTFYEYIERCGVKDKVVFKGYQQHIEEYYKKADIVISASRMEAFGRTTAEGMLSGALMITTTSGGSAEIVTDGLTGLSFTYGKANELYNKLVHALSNKTEMKEIAKAGQTFIINNMTAEINANSVYKHYCRIIRKVNNEVINDHAG